MKLAELKNSLGQRPDATIRFLLPTRDSVPIHAHVTEVARIDKQFVDCGGTLRNDSLCRLQTWFANDLDHRLTAGKLLKILEKAGSFLASDDLEVDVEHEVGFISQFPLESVEVSKAEIVLHLGERHTACLAPDKCGVPVSMAKPGQLNLRNVDFRKQIPAANCCSEESEPNR